ncbi:MAG: DNA repair and recombination protein RadA [Promethearchaeota archaeon]
MFTVDKLPGIKPVQVKRLVEAGISTAEALAMFNPKSLADDVEGISESTAKRLVWSAREALHLTAFTPAVEIDESYDHVTTGSAALDAILGGGVPTGRITEVAGAFKSGKTCLSHTVAVTTQLPRERGGIEKSVAFIDTENTFSRAKVERIARRFGLDPAAVLSRIFHVKVFSSDHQIQMVRNAEAIIESHDVGMLILDSLMALFRAEYVGIGSLAARQQVLNTLIHDLSRIAEVYNIGVLLTNQVATSMKGVYASEEAIGGNIVAHGCHFRVMFHAKGFQRNQSLERTATIVDAPDLPPDDCKFFITEAGVADDEKVVYPAVDGGGAGKKSKEGAKKRDSKAPEGDPVVPPANSPCPYCGRQFADLRNHSRCRDKPAGAPHPYEKWLEALA